MISESLLPYLMPLLGLALLFALIVVHRDDSQQRMQRLLLAALTVFVVFSGYSTIQKREKTSPTSLIVAGEGANLSMRSYMAFDFIKSYFPDVFNRLKPAMGSEPANITDEFVDQAEKVLRTALKEAPDSAYLQIRLALVLAQKNFDKNKTEIEGLLSNLQKSQDSRVSEYAGIIRKIYFGSVPKTDVESYAKTIETLMPLSWYRDTSLLRLYKVAGDSQAYSNYMQLSEQKAADWMFKIAIVIIAIPLLFLIGTLILFIQLGLLAAKKTGSPKLVPVPGIGDLQALYTVLIAWMANEVIVSSLMSLSGLRISSMTPVETSALLAITYLLSNGPSWFYIYWFALRRKAIGLFSGLKLSQPGGSLLPRIFWGLGAWMAAVPVVLFAFAVSNLFFGTHGSQSPVLAILFQIARSNNIPAIVLFYTSLAILAPLCEEPLFRGLLYQGLRSRIGIFGAAVVSAFLFAVLHLDPGGLLPLFALGLVLAAVFEKTGSLVPSMIAHGLWNGANFTVSLLVSSW